MAMPELVKKALQYRVVSDHELYIFSEADCMPR